VVGESGRGEKNPPRAADLRCGGEGRKRSPAEARRRRGGREGDWGLGVGDSGTQKISSQQSEISNRVGGVTACCLLRWWGGGSIVFAVWRGGSGHP